VAGNGEFGISGDGGPATSARLGSPIALALDAQANIYVVDDLSYVIRKISLTGVGPNPGSPLIGSAGGTVAGSGGDQVIIPPGTFATETRVTVGSVSKDEAQSGLGFDLAQEGFVFLRGISIETGNTPFLKPLQVSILNTLALPPSSPVIIVQIVPDITGDGVQDLVLVDIGIIKGNRIESFSSAPVPGIKSEGRFLLLQPETALIFAAGQVLDITGGPAVNSPVTTFELPKIFARTNSSGSYWLAVPAWVRAFNVISADPTLSYFGLLTFSPTISRQRPKTSDEDNVWVQLAGTPIVALPPIRQGDRNRFLQQYLNVICKDPEVLEKFEKLREQFQKQLQFLLSQREVAYDPPADPVLSCDKPQTALTASLLPLPEKITPLLDNIKNSKIMLEKAGGIFKPRFDLTRTIQISQMELGSIFTRPSITASPQGFIEILSNDASATGILTTRLRALANSPGVTIQGRLNELRIGYTFKYSVTLETSAYECEPLRVDANDKLALTLDLTSNPVKLLPVQIAVRGDCKLRLTKMGSGTGAVSSSPPGVDCPPDCQGLDRLFPMGSEITLSARAQSGSKFDGWSGVCAADPCVVKMDGHKGVIARFSTMLRKLSLTKTGTGSGAVSSSPPGINCPVNCLGMEQFFPDGTEITLSAVAQSSSKFDGWSGSCTAASDPCVVKMDADKEIIANFSTTSPAPANPVPTISSISPTSATAGGTGFNSTVNGANFVNGSVVRWNGSNRTTTFISSTQLKADIAAADIASPGTASMTVFNPAPGGGTSNALTFTIAGGQQSNTGRYTGTFNGSTKDTKTFPPCIFQHAVSADIVMTIDGGSGTLIDPYRGKLEGNGKDVLTVLQNNASKSCFGATITGQITGGTVSGSSGKVEAKGSVNAAGTVLTIEFTGGTFSGATLNGSIKINNEFFDTPITGTVSLTKAP
jgi:hypothetical protein